MTTPHTRQIRSAPQGRHALEINATNERDDMGHQATQMNRCISTTATIDLEHDRDRAVRVHRDLVAEEQGDGRWLVWAVRPETLDDHDVPSGSIMVADPVGITLLQQLFGLLADPDAFGAITAPAVTKAS